MLWLIPSTRVHIQIRINRENSLSLITCQIYQNSNYQQPMTKISILTSLILLYVLSSYCKAAHLQCQHCPKDYKDTLGPQTQLNLDLKNIKNFTMEQLKKLSQSEDILIVDARSFSQMTKGVIKNSIWVGYFTNGTWNGWFYKNVKSNKKIVLYGKDEEITLVMSILLRLGKKNIIGRVDFDIMDWKGIKLPCQQPQYVDKIEPWMGVLDVRTPLQWKKSMVKGSKLIQLQNIIKEVDTLEKNKTYVLVCRTGCRANIAMRMLKPFGLKLKVFNHPFEQIFKSKSCQKGVL